MADGDSRSRDVCNAGCKRDGKESTVAQGWAAGQTHRDRFV